MRTPLINTSVETRIRQPGSSLPAGVEFACFYDVDVTGCSHGSAEVDCVIDSPMSRGILDDRFEPGTQQVPSLRCLRIELHTEPTPHEFDSAPGISTHGSPLPDEPRRYYFHQDAT